MKGITIDGTIYGAGPTDGSDDYNNHTICYSDIYRWFFTYLLHVVYCEYNSWYRSSYKYRPIDYLQNNLDHL